MTAFAERDVEEDLFQLHLQLFSLNSRYLDIFIDLPDLFENLEFIIRKKIKSKLKRGKIKCNFYVNLKFKGSKLILNEELARKLINMALFLKKNGCDGKINPIDLLNFNKVIFTKIENKEKIEKILIDQLDFVLEDLIFNRKNEGKFLKKIIEKKLNIIQKEVEQVRYKIPKILIIYKDKLKEKIQQMENKLNFDKLEQEIILLTKRFNISEELDRIDFYVNEIKNIIKKKKSIGRYLEFITQELNREANTLSSKSIDIQIVKSSIFLKELIEEIREQAQNIE